jgi:hypothetical protein
VPLLAADTGALALGATWIGPVSVPDPPVLPAVGVWVTLPPGPVEPTDTGALAVGATWIGPIRLPAGFPRSQPRLWGVQGDGEAGAGGVNAADGLDRVGDGDAQDLVAGQQGVSPPGRRRPGCGRAASGHRAGTT